MNRKKLIDLNKKKQDYLMNNFRGRQLDYDYILLLDRYIDRVTMNHRIGVNEPARITRIICGNS